MAKRENPEMTSVGMTMEEHYPDFVLSDSRHADLEIEVPHDTYLRWTRARNEYEAVQREMEEYYDVAKEKLRRERAIAKAAKEAADANARLEALQRDAEEATPVQHNPLNGDCPANYSRIAAQAKCTCSVTGRLPRPGPQPQTQVSTHRNTDVLREMGHDL
jgi:hypothetical protein